MVRRWFRARSLAGLTMLGLVSVGMMVSTSSGQAGSPNGSEVVTSGGVLEIPHVPSSVDPGVYEDPKRQGPVETVSVEEREPAPVLTAAGEVLDVRPGETKVIRVAVNHANRIVTPFANPEFLTASIPGNSSVISVEEHVLYVSPRNENLITGFLKEKGDESVALAVVFRPVDAPPVDVELRVSGRSFVGASASGGAAAARWETTQPYVDTVSDIVKHVVLQTVPPGFELSVARDQDDAPRCDVPEGWLVQFVGGQRLQGTRLEVFVGTLINESGAHGVFQEPWCGLDGVSGVAVWPTASIPKNGVAEIIVVRQILDDLDFPIHRPSLLRAGYKGG